MGLLEWLGVERQDPRQGRYSWSEIEKAQPSSRTLAEFMNDEDDD
jgi:hypothetical protein